MLPDNRGVPLKAGSEVYLRVVYERCTEDEDIVVQHATIDEDTTLPEMLRALADLLESPATPDDDDLDDVPEVQIVRCAECLLPQPKSKKQLSNFSCVACESTQWKPLCDKPTELFEKIRGIIANRLDLPFEKADAIHGGTKLMDDLGADSLDIAEMSMDIEDEFIVRIPFDSEDGMPVTVGDIYKAVQVRIQ